MRFGDFPTQVGSGVVCPNTAVMFNARRVGIETCRV